MKASLCSFLFFIFFSSIPLLCHAQTSFTDSISNELVILDSDETRFDSIVAWTDQLLMKSDPNAIELAQKGKDLATSLNKKEEIALFDFELGKAYLVLELFDKAHIALDKSLSYYQSTENDQKQAEILNQKGRLYINQGKFEEAYKAGLKSIRIFERLEDKPKLGLAFADLSDVLWYLRRYEDGLDYGQKAVSIFTELNEIDGLANAHTQVAYSYLSLQQFDDALDEINKAISYQESIKEDILAIGYKYNARGNIYKFMGEYENAIADYQVSLDKSRQLNNKGGMGASLANIAQVYFMMDKFEEALPYQLEAIELQETSGHRANLPESYCLINRIYSRLDKIDESCSVFQHAFEIRDSLYSIESDRAISEFKTQYETEKKDEQIAAQEATIQQAKTIQNLTYAFVGLLGLFLLGLFYFFRRNQKQNTLLNNQNKIIEERNQQNELLLKEIHHRVKNNLQTISSLLNLQSANIDDPAALDAVKESQSRVASMALIHQKLYQGENLAAVEMKNYFETMGATLIQSFGGRTNNISIELPMDDIELDVDTAIPIGLIVNELVTNSLKHAFPDNREGKISLSLSVQNENAFQLKIADDGIGYSPDTKGLKTANGFGQKLVRLLTQQLSGNMQVVEDNGTAILIDFSSN